MGEQGHDEGHGLCGSAQSVKHRAFGGTERLVTGVTDEPLLLLRMGSVSKVEMVTPTAWSYKELFPSISTFETPPANGYQ